MELMMKTHSPETELVFTGNKDEAYKDIDFVFCQMRVGGSEYRSYDEKIPLKYGIIDQETCGPGGFAYGMRSIGDMIEMVNDVRKFSKETDLAGHIGNPLGGEDVNSSNEISAPDSNEAAKADENAKSKKGKDKEKDEDLSSRRIPNPAKDDQLRKALDLVKNLAEW